MTDYIFFLKLTLKTINDEMDMLSSEMTKLQSESSIIPLESTNYYILRERFEKLKRLSVWYNIIVNDTGRGQ
jgi:hypothetical protein